MQKSIASGEKALSWHCRLQDTIDQDRLSQTIADMEKSGVHFFSSFLSCPSLKVLAPLFATHPRSAFIVFCPKGDLAGIATQDLLATPNLIIALPADDLAYKIMPLFLVTIIVISLPILDTLLSKSNISRAITGLN